MAMILGTSTCHFVLSEKRNLVKGICGVGKNSILPGYYDYEAGQPCVGDSFDWFARACVPGRYAEQAAAKGQNILALLDDRVALIGPGESDLLALDWFNGNRSTLVDADLSGLIEGASVATKPEEIYRALVEATAFGTRVIIENFIENGVAVDQLYACGGSRTKARC